MARGTKAARPTLEALMGTAGAESFARSWGNDIVHLTDRPPGFYRRLVDLDDLERASVIEGRSRIVRYDDDVPAGFGAQAFGPPEMRARSLRRALAAGYTVSAHGVQEVIAPLAETCRALGRELDAVVASNAYMTPYGGRGFRRHADDHHVLVLQLHGEKRWSIWRPGSRKARSVALRPGDALYVPVGWPHEAAAVDAGSAHVTLGITPRSAGRAPSVSTSKSDITNGWMRAALTDLSAGTVLERRRALRWRVVDGLLDLQGGRRAVRLPPSLAPILRRLARAETVRTAAVPAVLEERSWTGLLRTLMEAGYFVVRPGPNASTRGRRA